MFEEQKSHFDTGDPSTALLVHQHEVSPCACCSPVFAELAQTMSVPDEELTDPAFWRKKNRCTGQAVRNAILINAKVLTVDESFSEASALAIKDGKIVAVGDDASVKAAADDDAEIIDCQGKIVLPGFIEPHMHFFPIAAIGRYEDIGPFRYPTVEGALSRLRSLAENAAPNEWIMGRQFDPSLQEGGEELTRDQLDTVSTTNAVFVYNASLHFGYCNSKALEIAGVSKDTPDDPSSPYGRDDDGEPNGVLKGGKAIGSVMMHNTDQRTYDLAEGCLDVCTKANAVGITTFCDQGTGLVQGVKELDIYRALAESGSMTARLRYSLSYALQDGFDKTGVAYGDGDEVIRATGWKIVSDGSNQGYSGLQREPYLHSDDKGIAYVEASQLTEMVLDRAGKGWPIVIHANGDQAIDNTLDAFEAAFDAGLLTNTPCRIEHCSILHDEQIERISKMGLSPSFLIGHVYYWGQVMRDKIFGEAKAALLDRTASCERKGIRWTLHSDEPVTDMGPLRCIENAVSRIMWKEPDSQLAPDECISVESAIRAMTRDAAWQCHSDHEIGSLEAGKFADFVILDKDPREVPVTEISQIRVLQTWMGGRKVFPL
ncbi:MAG: amidohydrolase [Gammaproteobacteria bacterium]|nr:amidohydrolase [Gammaproteobacteria bacterium]